MRIGRDQLIFRALAVLDEAVNACTQGVVQPSIGLRFALMFLYAIGRGGREAHDGFWRVIQESQDTTPSQSLGHYIRRTAAQAMMNGIAKSVGSRSMPNIRVSFGSRRCRPRSVARAVKAKQRSPNIAAGFGRTVGIIRNEIARRLEMNERPEVDAQLFSEHVSAIMSGLATAPATREGGRAVDGTAAMSSLLYVIAAMIEAHPDLGDDDLLQAAGAT